MERLTLRAIISVISVLSLSIAIGQDFNSITAYHTIEIKKNKAIQSAYAFLEAKYANENVSKRFVADSINSFLVCDDYKTYFHSKSAYCLAFGFEIKLDILLSNGNSWDTLQSGLFLPLDSSFSVLRDSLEDVWHNGFFDAWARVISNKYKINYKDVLRFIEQKGLRDSDIEFLYETNKHKKEYKFYWFVSGRSRKKGNSSILYKINPGTGTPRKVKTKMLRPLANY